MCWKLQILYVHFFNENIPWGMAFDEIANRGVLVANESLHSWEQ